MSSAVRFEGPAGRAAYVGASATVFVLQDVVLLPAFMRNGGAIYDAPWWVWCNPVRTLLTPTLAGRADMPSLLAAGMLAALAADAALVWLAFRRAKQIDRGGWTATLVIVPFLQLVAIAWLAAAPHRSGETDIGGTEQRGRLGARTAVSGLLIGVGSIVGTVALSTLVFHTYGGVLFLVSPFLIATAVGYLANRSGSVGIGRTLGLVFIAFLLGGAALIGFAFEGAICLLMATPLIAVMGFTGGALGAGLATLGQRGRGTTLTSIAFIPILLAAEAVLPPHAGFDSVVSTDVAAPPSAVWDAVVHMGPIPDAPAAPFRWGLAYPLSGEILGTGVGSMRRGVFSTGVAYERVTEWVPNEKLSFVVLSDPPTMHELSPYANVNAPHVSGYFRTLDARFTLTPLPDGRTRLTLATRHALDLEPAMYWLPLAQWAVSANKARVLGHFRQQAELSTLAR